MKDSSEEAMENEGAPIPYGADEAELAAAFEPATPEEVEQGLDAEQAIPAPDPATYPPTLLFLINFNNIHANFQRAKGNVSVKTAQDLVSLAAQYAGVFTQIELQMRGQK